MGLFQISFSVFLSMILIFSILTSIPFANEILKKHIVAAVTPMIEIQSPKSDGSGGMQDAVDAKDRIYYIQAGIDFGTLVFSVSADDAGSDLSISSSTEQLPPEFLITQDAHDKIDVNVNNITSIPDTELPASYVIEFNATTTGTSPISSFADVVFVIEPSNRPQPTVEFDKPIYSDRDNATIIINDTHLDCVVPSGSEPKERNIAVTGFPGITGGIPASRDNRDPMSATILRTAPLHVPSNAPTVTATYAPVLDSDCVFPAVQIPEGRVTVSASVILPTISFNSASYVVNDPTGQNSDKARLTIVDNGATGLDFVNVKLNMVSVSANNTETLKTFTTTSSLCVATDVEMSSCSMTLDRAGVSGTFTKDFSVSDLLSPGLDEDEVKIIALYDVPGNSDLSASATVSQRRGLSFTFSEGNTFYYTNETAALQLTDPNSNTHSDNFDTKWATLCTYDATAPSDQALGTSVVQLGERSRDSAIFVTSYRLAFVNQTDVLNDESKFLSGTDRDNYKSYIRNYAVVVAANHDTTVIVWQVGNVYDPSVQCPPSIPGSTPMNPIATIKPSIISDPDSAGRGQNIGATPHNSPPLVTAAQVNCNQYSYGPDTDGDGACDNWETASGLKLYYPAGGSQYWIFTYTCDPCSSLSYKHLDVYLEIDYVDNSNCAAPNNINWKPSTTAINNVKTAFANGDITNVDGTKGIKLHAYVGENIGGTNCPTSLNVWKVNGDSATDNSITTGDSYDEAKNTFFGKDSTERPNLDKGKGKWQVFHYGLFIPMQTQDTASSGVAEQLGNDLVVSLGIGGAFDNSVDEQQGTLMHELGHNLGLYHGGSADISGNDYNTNCKPNYPSVMTYIGQMRTPWTNASLTYSEDEMSNQDWQTDPYVSSTDPDEMAELKLSSQSSLSSVQIVWGISDGTVIPPAANVGKSSYANIDWSNNGAFSDSNSPPGSSQVINLGIPGCTSADPDGKIHAAEDWSHLKYNFRELNPDAFSTGFHFDHYAPLEVNSTIIHAIRNQSINTINYLVQNLNNDDIQVNNGTGCADPQFDGPAQNPEPGDSIDVLLGDPNYNLDPDEKDPIKQIRVYSDSDLVGQEYDATETGINNGIFEFGFDTSSSNSSSGKIFVKTGDDIHIQYVHPCLTNKNVPINITFRFNIGVGHKADPQIEKGSASPGVKSEFQKLLISNPDSIQKLVLNETVVLDEKGKATERASLENAIKELKNLTTTMDCMAGGICTDDLFAISNHVKTTLEFTINTIASFELALNTPYDNEGQTFNVTSYDFDCQNGVSASCTIIGNSDTATATIDTFQIDPTKERILLYVVGQGNLTLQFPEELVKTIYHVQSAVTGRDLNFEVINSTSIRIIDAPYSPNVLSIFYGPDLVAPATPRVTSNNGTIINTAAVGQQNLVLFNLTNYQRALNLSDYSQNFTLVFEVRDSSNITQNFAVLSGVIAPDVLSCTSCVQHNSTLWTLRPWNGTTLDGYKPGDYQLRIFLVDDLDSPKILSAVRVTTITVEGS